MWEEPCRLVDKLRPVSFKYRDFLCTTEWEHKSLVSTHYVDIQFALVREILPGLLSTPQIHPAQALSS